VVPLPLAAWNETVRLQFNESGGTNSGVSINGVATVQAIRIDDLVAEDIEINYIKMDIEGAELMALEGARKTISRQTPHLAICVYHEPGHLWEIGLWIEENFPQKYKMYLRTYAEQTFETVLYCIPS